MHPIQFVMSIMGMTLFPFIGRPVLQAIGSLSAKEYQALMEERKTLIPKWMGAILKVK